jgi:predicted membrane protein
MNKKILNERRNSNLSSVVVLGGALVLIGLLLLAFNLGWLNPAFKCIIISWPMLLIALAIIGYFKRQILFPTILLFTGVFFLIPRLVRVYPDILGEFGKNFASNYWPFLLICIGLILIIGVAANRRKRACFKKKVVNRDETGGGWIIKDIVFGGSESLFLEPVLKGGDIDVVFGGIVIDLRQTTLPETTVHLNIDVVFGGITLYVPENWCVSSNLDSVFGGYSDKRPNAAIVNEESNSKLIIQGSLIFSGCTVQ